MYMYKYFDIMATTTTMRATNNPLTKVGHIYLMWDEIQVKQCLWSLFPILSVQILYYLPTFANRYIHTYNISMAVIDDWTSHQVSIKYCNFFNVVLIFIVQPWWSGTMGGLWKLLFMIYINKSNNDCYYAIYSYACLFTYFVNLAHCKNYND